MKRSERVAGTFVFMNIFTLIDPGKGHTPCIQAFSTQELATQAKELYALHDRIIVEVPLAASAQALNEWTRFQWAVQIYFVLDTNDLNKPVQAYTSYIDYKEHLHRLEMNHPWVGGTLDGLRRSVELGLRMYRVHMHESGEIGVVEGALAFNAVTTCSARLYSLDHEMRMSEATRGANWQDGPYFIYVYALDDADAVGRARPYLERKRKDDKQPTPYW